MRYVGVHTSHAVQERVRCITYRHVNRHICIITTLDLYKNGNFFSSAHTYSHAHPTIATIHFPLLHLYCRPHEEYHVIGWKSYTVLLHSNVLFCIMELSFRCLGKSGHCVECITQRLYSHLSLVVCSKSRVGLAFHCAVKSITG